MCVSPTEVTASLGQGCVISFRVAPPGPRTGAWEVSMKSVEQKIKPESTWGGEVLRKILNSPNSWGPIGVGVRVEVGAGPGVN